MIIGTGIDIVELSRISKAYDKWGARLAEKLLTPGEVEILLARKDSAAYLASRFAAKEAFLKALGTGYSRGIGWHDIEVSRIAGQRPLLRIGGKAKEIMSNIGATRAHLSMSHEKNYALAQVILEN